MKFTLSADAISGGLAAVGRAVSVRTSLPILSNVLIEAKDGKVDLTATSLDLTIHHSVAASVESPGRIALPAKLLGEFVHSLSGGEIVCDEDVKTRAMHIQSGRFDARIKGMDADEFPPMPNVADGDTVEIDGDAFLQAIDRTVVAASGDESRPVYTGVLASFAEASLTLVATDGHRLAVSVVGLGEQESDEREPFQVIVPAKALSEVSKLLKPLAGTGAHVSVGVNAVRSKVRFGIGAYDVTSSLIEGAYPSYEKVVPATSGTIVKANTADLRATAKTVSLFARDAANVLKLNAADGQLILSANTNEVGDGVAPVEVGIDGEAVIIALNGRYLTDVLTLVTSPEIEFCFNGPLSPGMVRIPDDASYRYVIMPVRIAA
ncbi:MAG: DNA polymerase III subunit beta [Candidatus Dormibacteria bacterium]